MGDLYINDFDDELRHRLKIRAVQEGILLRDIVERACRHELRGQKPAAPPKKPAKAQKTVPKPAAAERKIIKRPKPAVVKAFAEPEVIVSDLDVATSR